MARGALLPVADGDGASLLAKVTVGVATPASSPRTKYIAIAPTRSPAPKSRPARRMTTSGIGSVTTLDIAEKQAERRTLWYVRSEGSSRGAVSIRPAGRGIDQKLGPSS